jgi:integrase
VSSRLVREDRRILYGLELLTGMRPGEAFARRFNDVDPVYAPIGRILAATAWSSDNRCEKPTKTRVPKAIPLHPSLRAALQEWWAHGFERVMKRAPRPDDLIVPAPRCGGFRKATQVNRDLARDLAALGLRKRINYDARATFRSLICRRSPESA